MNNINLDWFSFWSGIVPDQKAITMLPTKKSHTYGEINRKAIEIASTFYHKYGVRKGDRVVLLSKNCIENIWLFAAAQKIGFILVPLNYRLTAYELTQLIQDAEPILFLFDTDYKIDNINCPSLTLDQLKTYSHIDGIPETRLSPTDAIFILYTSGSTGNPKGVMYTHRMLYWNSMNTSVSLGVNADTSALVCMPPFHTGGWNVLLSPVLHHGGHVILTEKFSTTEIISALDEFNCNQFMAVPTMLKMMSEDPDFDHMEVPHLPYIIVGGEAMDIDLISIYEEKNIPVRQGFGMTEAGPNLTSLHHAQSKTKIGSIGKPNMYVEIKLIDENLQEVEPGELGELCFSGPVVMTSYWKNEQASVQSFTGNWLRSGDIAMMDEEGYIYIKDRIKNMFISGGENVYPAEIEKTLLQHSLVSQVAVIGVSNDTWGEVGKAFIVAQGLISEEAIMNFCRTKLSKFKIPKYFEFVDELPINSTGKIDRKALKNR